MWMMAVALVAVVSAVLVPMVRIVQYTRRAEEHARLRNSAEVFKFGSSELIEWHRRMEHKYARAARNPWFPAPPDPPKPE